ncbi:MAG: IgGFc-binding protein [Labilithrix sp.]|nr:IgGFc-binding protein [Labilithrix sp.]
MKRSGVSTLAAIAAFVVIACGSSKRDGFGDGSGGEGAFSDAGAFEGGEAGAGKVVRDPTTCAEALAAKTYVGCDYWPTVTANLVQDVFDFAVAVANVGADPASVTVTGPNGVSKTANVAPGSLEKIYLPWVPELKGGDLIPLQTSVLVKGGAYHLVSDRPVVVYQFNPLQFRAKGGEPGKDWSSCRKLNLSAADCYSYSNDASLLLPSTAMTGSYRIMGSYGFSRHDMIEGTATPDLSQPAKPGAAPYFVVTGTANGTTVSVKLGPKGKVVAGGGISAAPAGGTLTFTLDAGDVAEVLSGSGRDFDFSGSLLSADKPVQVITGVPCIDFPLDVIACDHVEETVFPAQTLGRHYVVTTPTGPKNNKVGHVVRLFGNVDGTTLTYKPSPPPGCPTTLSAGQVVDCGDLTTSDFEVTGSNEFGIAMFLIGASKADPDFNGNSLAVLQGDPDQTFAVAVEQYRLRYVFLAPNDYKTNYVDVIAPAGAKVDLDSAEVTSKLTPIAGTDFLIGRLQLSNAGSGVHVLTADQPVGIQVLGYGDYTTYMYPGGLNLGEIAPIPPK